MVNKNQKTKNSKARFTLTILVITLLIVAVSCAISFESVLQNGNKTSAFVATSTPSSIGSLTYSDYATRTGSPFNVTVLKKLYGAISTGKGGASTSSDTYQNAYNKVKASTATLVGYSQNNTTITENYTMDFRALSNGTSSNTAGGGTAPNPITVEFGGFKWNVVYATTRTVNDNGTINEGTGDLIVTLWLSETDGTKHQWSYFTSKETSGSYTCDMYSNSMVRISSLNGGGGDTTRQYAIGINSLSAQISTTSQKNSKYAPFTLSESYDGGSYGKKSLKKYLEPIKHLQYQRTENFIWGHSVSTNMGWLINEAWGSGTDGVTGPSTSIKGANGNLAGWGSNTSAPHTKTTYYDWKEDTLWLPSVAETGRVSSDNVNKDTSIWGIPQLHNIVKSDMGILTRSGATGSIDGICYLGTDGKSHSSSSPTYTDCGIRPALHLNLTAAEKSLMLTVPSNVTTTYNGAQQDYYKSDGVNVGWYDANLYSSANANVKVEYSKNNVALDAGVKPLEYGTYKVKLTIQNTDYKWASGNATVQEFNYTINKKSLTVSCDWNASPPKATPTNLCSRDTGLKNEILKIRYNTVGLTDYTYDYPTKVGKDYVATVEIDTDKSNNYKLASTYSTTFTLSASGVAEPEVVLGNDSEWLTYNGQERAYRIDYKKDKVKIEIADEYKDKNLFELDDDKEYIYVTNAGEYKNAIKATLLDPYDPSDNSGSDVWAGTSADTAPRYISFTLKALNLTVTSTSSLIDAQMGDTPNLNIMTPNKPIEGHTLTVDVMGQLDENSTPRSIGQFTFSSASSNAQNVTLDLSGLRVTGDYLLSFVVDNENYALTFSSPVTLHLDYKSATPTLTWWLQENGVMTGDTVDAEIGKDTSVDFDVTDLIYNGKEYSFMVTANNGYSVNTEHNAGEFSAGYKNAKATNAGDYVTQVAIKKDGEETKFYSINWTIGKAKFNLSGVEWENDGKYEFTGSPITPGFTGLPNGLAVKDFMGDAPATNVGSHGEITVRFKIADGYLDTNYYLPEQGGDNYDGEFTWSISWEIIPVQIKLVWDYEDVDGDIPFRVLALTDDRVADKIDYLYYETNVSGEKLDEEAEGLTRDEIEVISTQAKYFKAYPILQSLYEGNYEFPSEVDLYSPVFRVGGDSTAITVSLATTEYNYTGKDVSLRWATGTPTGSLKLTYYEGDVFGNKIDHTPKAAGTYWVEVESNNTAVVLDGETKFKFKINKSVVSSQWKTSGKPPVLSDLTSLQLKEGITYEFYDENMQKVEFSALSAGGTFKIRAVLSDTLNFALDNGKAETELIEFTVAAGEELLDPSDISNPNYSFDDEENPPSGVPSGEPSGDADGSGDGGGAGTLDELLKKLGEIPLWQLIASVISIILIIVFMSKTAKYNGERKKFNKKADKFDTVYAGAFLGLALTVWTAIACALIGVAVLSLVMMLIAKSKRNKAEEEYDERLEEYQRNKADFEDHKRAEEYARKDEEARRRDEDMKMMFMNMFGGGMQGGMGQGMPQGAYMGGGYGIGADEIRGIVSETMTAMLPGMQQMLPQQASRSDELVEKLLEKSEKSEEAMLKMMEKSQKNEEEMRDLLRQLTKQTNEKVVEREVAATSTVTDEAIKSLIEGQRIIMEKLANQQPQIIEKEVPIEKIVEKVVEVPVEVEKIVEVEKEVIKEVPVEVPIEVEKIVEKEVKVEVPVEVEKIVEVEKEVIKEVKVEVPVEVEKIVEVEKEVIKEVKVEVPVAAPPKPKKEVAPKLTLDEAYALLSKEQKKYFDGLKAYALSKDKCKEKKSTYFTVFGQTTTNPILKLAIKKDTTVALLKMEDEFMKDLRRDASGDGTKVKVKETEIVVSDAQAFDTAKKMIDLREDQIERYQDLLKEQRASRK